MPLCNHREGAPTSAPTWVSPACARTRARSLVVPRQPLWPPPSVRLAVCGVGSPVHQKHVGLDLGGFEAPWLEAFVLLGRDPRHVFVRGGSTGDDNPVDEVGPAGREGERDSSAGGPTGYSDRAGSERVEQGRRIIRGCADAAPLAFEDRVGVTVAGTGSDSTVTSCALVCAGSGSKSPARRCRRHSSIVEPPDPSASR